MIEVGLADLLGCLQLQADGDDVLVGANLDIGYHRVFGGQILAQILVAAQQAVPDKSVRSSNVLFPREGDADRPMRYRVTVHQRGRTFATVGVVGFQVGDGSEVSVEDRVVAVATVSLHAREDGLHHSAAPPPVGAPEDAPVQHLDLIPFDVRVVGGVDLADRRVGPPRLEWWLRAPDGLERATIGAGVDVATAHQALLGHSTDLTVIGTALRPIEGVSQADSTAAVATAVTGHSLVFHQPFRVDDWLLVVQEAPIVAQGRAFGRGDVFQGDELVASFSQESMIRPR